MLKTGTTYYPIISTIAFVATGGLTYHLLTTMCKVDTFSGLCGFVAVGLSAVLLVSLIFGKKAKASNKAPHVEQVEIKDSDLADILPQALTVDEAPIITPDKTASIEVCREYVSQIAEKYFQQSQRSKLMEIFDSYCNRRISPVKITTSKDDLGLSSIDLMHFMVNVWRKMKWIDRRFTARFLKESFPGLFKNTSEQTIYSKMTNDDLPSIIPLIDTDAPLIAA